MHFTDSDKTGQKIWFFLRIRLVHHAFVAISRGTRLIGINPGDNQDLILNGILYFPKPGKIVTYGVFVIGRTGTDNSQKLIGFSGKYIADFLIALIFQSFDSFGDGILSANLRRGR